MHTQNRIMSDYHEIKPSPQCVAQAVVDFYLCKLLSGQGDELFLVMLRKFLYTTHASCSKMYSLCLGIFLKSQYIPQEENNRGNRNVKQNP